MDQGSTLSLQAGTSITLSATVTVTGGASNALTWSTTCGALSGSGSSVTFTAPDTPCTCTVRATSTHDPSRSAALVVTVVSGAAPPEDELVTPKALTAALDGAGVRLAWRYELQVPGISFELERAVDDAAYELLAILPADARSHLDDDPPAGVDLSYRVRATTLTGASPYGANVLLAYVVAGPGIDPDAFAFAGSENRAAGFLVPAAAIRAGAPLMASFTVEPDAVPEGRSALASLARLSVGRDDLDLTTDEPLFLLLPPHTDTLDVGEGHVGALVRVATRNGDIVTFPTTYTRGATPTVIDLWWLRDIDAVEGLSDPVVIEILPLFTPRSESLDVEAVGPDGEAEHASFPSSEGDTIRHVSGLLRLDGTANPQQMADVCDDEGRVHDLSAALSAFAAVPARTAQSEWTRDVGRRPLVLVHGWQGIRHASLDRARHGGTVAALLCSWQAFIAAYGEHTDLRDAFTLYSYGYDSVQDRIAENGARFAQRISQAFPGEAVYVIAHSMGGLVVHDAIEREAEVAQLYSLGTPFRGSAATECVLADSERCLGVESVVQAPGGSLGDWLLRQFLADQTHSLGYEGTKDLAFEQSFFSKRENCRLTLGGWRCELVPNPGNPYLVQLNAAGPRAPQRYTAFAGNIIRGDNDRVDTHFEGYGLLPGVEQGARQMRTQLLRYGDYIVSVASAVFGDIAAEVEWEYATLRNLDAVAPLSRALLAPCLDHGMLVSEEHPLLLPPSGQRCATASPFPDGGTTVFGWIAADLMREVPTPGLSLDLRVGSIRGYHHFEPGETVHASGASMPEVERNLTIDYVTPVATVYVAIKQDGAAPTQDVQVSIQKDGSPLIEGGYPAGAAWEVFLVMASLTDPDVDRAHGTYRATAAIGSEVVEAVASFDRPPLPSPEPVTLDPSGPVPSPPNTLGVRWAPSAGATKTIVGVTGAASSWWELSEARRVPAQRVVGPGVDRVSLPGPGYGAHRVVVTAHEWDPTLARTEPYPEPVPATFRSTSATAGLSVGRALLVSLDVDPFDPSATGYDGSVEVVAQPGSRYTCGFSGFLFLFDCSYRLVDGASVTLTAVDGTVDGSGGQSVFAGWGGDCGAFDQARTCTLTMAADREVSVRFVVE